MRRRIWRISEDRFDDPKPDLSVSPETLNLTFPVRGSHAGEFVLKSENQVPARGIIYSSNPYVICQNPQFEGSEITVRYQLSDAGFTGEDCLEGNFSIIYNQGSLRLPYRFTFTEKKEEKASAEPSVYTPEDLVRIYRKDPEGALRLFLGKNYAEAMEKASMEKKLLYRGFVTATPTLQNLENYLVDSRVKDPVLFSVEKKEEKVYGLTEDWQGHVDITRSTWGYTRIHVESDVDFIEPEKDILSESDFLGVSASLHFLIRKDRLHGGRNQGHIRLFDRRSSLTVTVEAGCLSEEDLKKRSEENRKPRIIVSLYKDYISFRLGRMEKDDWAKKTLDSLDLLSRMEEEETEKKRGFLSYRENVWLNLVRCYAHLVNDDRQEALYFIRELKEDIRDHSSPAWAALLYLCIKMEDEEDYRTRLTKEIEEIFAMNPDDLRIFLLLLHLRTSYERDPAWKLKDIRQWAMNGYASPLLYLEAMDLYEKAPYLLNEFNPFTFRVLAFIRKYKAFSDAVSMQLVEILSFFPVFDERVLKILMACYKDHYRRDDLLKRILTYLLLGRKFKEAYLSWYLLGIEKDMDVPGIYEAYLYSLPLDSVKPLPKKVKLYFRYPNQLPFEQKALLFANCVLHKNEDPETYKEYFPEIAKFAEEGLRAGRLNDNMTILYRDLLKRELVTDDDCQSLARLFFVKKAVPLRKKAVRLVVYENSRKNPRMFPIVNGLSYLTVTDPEYRIFLEDGDGCRFAEESRIFLEDILPESSRNFLNNHAKEPYLFQLSDLIRRGKRTFESGDVSLIQNLLSDEEISDDFRRELYPAMLDFLKRQGKEEILTSYLWDHRKDMVLPVRLRKEMLSFGIEKMDLDQAYEILKTQNGLVTDPKLLLWTVNFRIVRVGFQEEDFLVSLAAWLFRKDCASEQSLSYLNRYYSGPDREMKKLFLEVEKDRMQDRGLSERILIQMLYSSDRLEYPSDIYLSYKKRSPNRMVVEAFLTFWSRQYLLYDQKPDLAFFSDLKRLEETKDAGRSCRLALLKELCLENDRSEKDEKLLDDLLNDYTRRKIWFTFYKNADQALQIRYQINDKLFLEYHGEAGRELVLEWQKNDGPKQRELLKEMYDGIYLRPFVLFYSDRVKYQILTPEGERLAGGSLSGAENADIDGKNYFSEINRIEKDREDNNKEKLAEDIKSFAKRKRLTQHLFHWI
ncbi:MAG: DUF5717 family protein [Lachnospiraceae bacterium]|nr:DUF5717 family protein [Lachnospiraceae bacterium]